MSDYCIKEKMEWDEYFMEIAELAAKRSSCYSPKGAVIVRDNSIISTGYNGASKGDTECISFGFCRKREAGYGSGNGHDHCNAAHAELNAIVLAAKNGNSINNSTLYCTHYPCSLCMRYIANSGICKIVFRNEYPDKETERIAFNADIQLVRLDKEIQNGI